MYTTNSQAHYEYTLWENILYWYSWRLEDAWHAGGRFGSSEDTIRYAILNTLSQHTRFIWVLRNIKIHKLLEVQNVKLGITS
jgi:hypothetical protein